MKIPSLASVRAALAVEGRKVVTFARSAGGRAAVERQRLAELQDAKSEAMTIAYRAGAGEPPQELSAGAARVLAAAIDASPGAEWALSEELRQARARGKDAKRAQKKSAQTHVRRAAGEQSGAYYHHSS